MIQQYEVKVEGRNGTLFDRVGYGELKKIFVLTLPTDQSFKALSGETLVLTLITPWETGGKNAARENTFMESKKADIVTDVRSLKATVGLVRVGKQWGIIDRQPATDAKNFEGGMRRSWEAEDEGGVGEGA